MVCCLREPCGKVQFHKQWPQCSSNRLARTLSEDTSQSDCKSPSLLLLICSVRKPKHVGLRVGRIEIWKAQRLELSWPLAWNVQWTDRFEIWIGGSQHVPEQRTNVFVQFPLVVVHFWSSSVLHRVGSVTLLHAHFLLTHRPYVHWLKISRFQGCVVRIKTSSSPCHPWCRTRIQIHPLACTWAFHLCLPIPQPHLHLRLRCRSPNTAKIHKKKSVANTTCSTGYEPNVIDNFDYSETYSDLPEWIRRRTRSMRNSTISLSEKRYPHQCSLRREKNQRTWDKLITLLKKACCQLSPFRTHKYGKTRVRTKFKFVSKTEIKSRPGNKQMWILLGRRHEQILAQARCEIQQHELQADSDRRRIQELLGIIDSQRLETDHTITGCEQPRRDQLPPKEERPEQNRDPCETCIRNMRDMEELQ